MGGGGKALVDAEQIGALSIVAANIAASTITAGKMSVSQLSAIAVDAGTLTAGSIAVIASGNTIGFTPAGTNAIFSGTTGSPEFKVTPAGALTATSVTITGDVTATSGVTAGWVLTTTQLYALASGTPSSSPNDGIVLTSGSTSSIKIYEDTALRVEIGNLSAGVFGIKAYDGAGSTVLFEVSDTQTVIGGWNFIDGFIYNLQSGTPSSSPNDGLVLASGNEGMIIYENTEKRVEVGFLSTGIYGLKVYADDGSTVIFEASDTQILMSGVPITGIPNSTATDISLLTLNHDLVFSVTDADTIAWASGTITLANGRTFSIVSGNTGNMSALTYIYLDPGTSSTVLQTTTTTATAIGADKALIGVAQNQTVTASFVPYGGGAKPLIDGEQIGAVSIVTGNMAANSITATEINVSNLAAINANMGSITAGDIVLPSGGFIRSGQTAFDTGTGFYIANDSGTPKFSFGDSSANKITWDGSSLVIVGDLPDIQNFSADGTWTKPANAKFVYIVCVGAGGGAGSGQRGNERGGGGGGAGAASVITLLASALGSTESVTVGSTASGGAAQTSDNTAGNDGTNGGSSSFGSWLFAGGGGKGIGGSASAADVSGGGGGWFNRKC